MMFVPDERATIDHKADEKLEIKLIDWGTNFAVYPLSSILPVTASVVVANPVTMNLYLWFVLAYLPEDGSTPNPLR